MQVGGLSQKDIMSEWKRAFLISQTSRAQPMEQREQKPNLFGLCRNIVQTRAESSLLGCAECSRYSTKLIVTEEDEVKLT